jgi:hypothetical protein
MPVTVPIVTVANETEEPATTVTVLEEPKKVVAEPQKVFVIPQKAAVAPQAVVVEKNPAVDPKKLPVVSEINKTIAYPNPASDRIIIATQSGFLNDKGIQLYDVGGRACPVKITKRIAQNSLELDISLLRNGFYLIRLKLAEGYVTLRFVKG